MRERLFRYSFFLLTLLYMHSVMGQGQNFDGCLSHAQLYELYSGNVQSMGQMMGRQHFFMVSNDDNVTFMWRGDTIVMNLCNWQFAQGFNDIYVNAFYQDGFYTEELMLVNNISSRESLVIVQTIRPHLHTDTLFS